MKFIRKNLLTASVIGIFSIMLVCNSCTSRSSRIAYEKTPVDLLIQKLQSTPDFSIVLYDMDYDESINKYKHKYNVIIPTKESVDSQISNWVNVSDIFFDANKDNMGMEIATKKDGKLSKIVSPAGYSNYVGNKKYGRWEQRNGSSFWEFYGKYAMLSSLFRMSMYPVHHSYYNSYRGHYNTGRSYYGPSSNGRSMYGTNSAYNSSRKNSSWNNKPSSFKSRVRSKVSRSATTSKRSILKRRSRSSSRYSRSSTRSRSRGFGK